MSKKELKIHPAELIEEDDELLEELEEEITEEEDDELLEELEEEITEEEEIEVELEDVKGNIKEEEKYYVTGTTLVLNGRRFNKGEEVTVRPIPSFYIENGHVYKK